MNIYAHYQRDIRTRSGTKEARKMESRQMHYHEYLTRWQVSGILYPTYSLHLIRWGAGDGWRLMWLVGVARERGGRQTARNKGGQNIDVTFFTLVKRC